MAEVRAGKGKIQTVTGLMEPAALGPTLMHEHLLWDITRPEVLADGAAEVMVSLDNVWEVNRRSTQDFGNQHMTDPSVALDEVKRLRADGGGAIVDLTTFGLKPDPAGLRYVSKESGVPIVQGAGLITALRMLGAARALRFLAKAALPMLKQVAHERRASR